MIPVFINIFTVVLLLVAVFIGLVVLMQRAKADGGMAAMGGGMAESAFGPDTSNVLSKATINAAIIFFVLSFALYLGHVRVRSQGRASGDALPNISAPPADSSSSTGSPPAGSEQAAPPAVSVPADTAQPTAPNAPAPKADAP